MIRRQGVWEHRPGGGIFRTRPSMKINK